MNRIERQALKELVVALRQEADETIRTPFHPELSVRTSTEAYAYASGLENGLAVAARRLELALEQLTP